MITTTIKEQLIKEQETLGLNRIAAEKALDIAQQQLDKRQKDLDVIDKRSADVQKDLDKIAAFEKWDAENNTVTTKAARAKKDAATTTEEEAK